MVSQLRLTTRYCQELTREIEAAAQIVVASEGKGAVV